MKALIHTSIIAIFLIFLSCSSQEKSPINNRKYTNENFGWEMQIPSNWRIATQLEEDYYKKEGLEASKEAFGEKSINNTWTTFLNLQKGVAQNIFTASVTMFKSHIHTAGYEASQQARFQGMKQVLENNTGITVEDSRATMMIDGVNFDVCNMLIKSNGSFKAYQILLEKKYANDEILLLTLTASDRESLDELRNMLEHSTFSRKG